MNSIKTHNNLFDLLTSRAGSSPAGTAILAPGFQSLSWDELIKFIRTTTAGLAAAGVKGGDRVAMVLPNGPSAATAFLAVSNLATTAPFNPAYSLAEFEYFLSDMHASTLLIDKSLDSPARLAATQLGLPILEISTDPESPAGVFTLSGETRQPGRMEFSGGQDIALVLHTSGTTSRPKIVPLTHANLRASAENISRSMDLTAQDRCLNIMPLFHVHGLMAAVVGSLVSGGSVICAPGLKLDEILDWIDFLKPTWLTAVPTMLQILWEQAVRDPGRVQQTKLRFIRACSSALSPVLAEKLEETFHVPVLEAYGMTEASHQIAINPQPPEPHKFGSVGRPFGDDVAILDTHGTHLPQNTIGEISLRGDNIMGGYESNPDANQAAFSDGWLRTGDLGLIDDEGYIYIKGRVKEIINKGGEKVSPREIDEVLLTHPAVSQAVAFPVPHPTLGEDIAAAVMLHPGSAVTPAELSAFAAKKLALFKVPHPILIVNEIPKGPTGKIQRMNLAEKLKDILAFGGQDVVKSTRQLTRMEQELATIWSDVLGQSGFTSESDFFVLGGDSIKAVQVISRLSAKYAIKISVSEFFQLPTLKALADAVDTAMKTQ